MTSNIPATTIRPGILVALRTSVTGNVKYAKRVIEAGRTTETGEHVAEWETIRTIADRDEHDRAVKVRSEARGFLTKVCIASAFGLLCPEADSPDLLDAIAKAKALCAEFNKTSTVTTVSFNALMGRVAQDDVEAVKAISAEVRDLLSDMKEGVERLDVDRIRKAALEATQIGQMLTPEAQGRLQVAIAAARQTAKDIVRAGETAAIEIDRSTIRKLTEARTTFLDLDGEREAPAPVVTGRGVDLTSDEPAPAPVAAGRKVELV
jgi:hypothetical protein